MLSATKLRYEHETRDLLFTMSRLSYLRSLGFHCYGWQAAVIESDHRRKTINGARQAGKSTIVSLIPCHRAKYFRKSKSIVLGATERQAFLDMRKIKDFIAMDREYPDITRSSDVQIELANGSVITVVPATEKSARGDTPDVIVGDESSRIEDDVYRSGVVPMLNDNAECEFIQISTPNGRLGFFYRSQQQNRRWERYEVRSPWDVLDLEYRLAPAMEEEEYRKRKAAAGILAYYSPRHRNLEEQQMALEEMGPMLYRQENCCEFVEPDDQVFGYDAIEAMFAAEAPPLDISGIPEAPPLIGA
jgi:hypothetical protein